MEHVARHPGTRTDKPRRTDPSGAALPSLLNGSCRMTLAPVRHSCTRGPLIAVEGITGVGKTYLTHRAIDAIEAPAAKPLLLDGFSQRADGRPGLGEALLRALRDKRKPQLKQEKAAEWLPSCFIDYTTYKLIKLPAT